MYFSHFTTSRFYILKRYSCLININIYEWINFLWVLRFYVKTVRVATDSENGMSPPLLILWVSQEAIKGRRTQETSLQREEPETNANPAGQPVGQNLLFKERSISSYGLLKTIDDDIGMTCQDTYYKRITATGPLTIANKFCGQMSNTHCVHCFFLRGS